MTYAGLFSAFAISLSLCSPLCLSHFQSLEHSIPLYFTVTAQNNQKKASTATCHIHTYDITLPRGRVTPEFTSTSNPNILRASGVAYDDSAITMQYEGVGFGTDIYGDQVIHWHEVKAKIAPPVPSGMSSRCSSSYRCYFHVTQLIS